MNDATAFVAYGSCEWFLVRSCRTSIAVKWAVVQSVLLWIGAHQAWLAKLETCMCLLPSVGSAHSLEQAQMLPVMPCCSADKWVICWAKGALVSQSLIIVSWLSKGQGSFGRTLHTFLFHFAPVPTSAAGCDHSFYGCWTIRPPRFSDSFPCVCNGTLFEVAAGFRHMI